MVVYLDVVIIENFLIDLFLLMSTCKIMRFNIATKRIILASVIGSIYTVTFFIPSLKVLSTLPFQIVISYLIMFVLLKNSAMITKCKAVGVFILLSILLSGTCFLLLVFDKKYSFIESFNLGNNTLKNIVMSVIVMYLVCHRVISYFKERTLISNFKFDIEVELDNLKYFIKGFLDTGNELREPLTNLPCILVEDHILGNLQRSDSEYYMIPYSAIGVNGKLKGIKVDKIRIRREGEGWKEIKAIICPCKEILSRENDFNALLSRGIL